MADPYLSEIKLIAFNYPPRGWAFCNGQILPINQNQALFSLLGTTYGGNGVTTFALPNLQSRIAMHFGTNYNLGQTGGETAHTLITSEIPAHTHLVSASSLTPNKNTAANNFFASNTGFSPYGKADESMHPSALANAGGSQPHDNMSPYLVLNYVIALVGIFPSRN
jgi:microcystin-dependent protein